MSTLTLDTPLAQAGGAGGRKPPRGPVAAASAGAPNPGESATVRKRSFSFLPAHLSPVKRGEVRVPRPAALVGTGERGFAFHPAEAGFARARPNDQFFAHTAQAAEGEIVVAIRHDGSALVGTCREISDARLLIQQGSDLHALATDDVAETAIVVMIETKP